MPLCGLGFCRPRVEAEAKRGSYPQSDVPVISRRDRVLRGGFSNHDRSGFEPENSPYTAAGTRWIPAAIRLTTSAYSRARPLQAIVFANTPKAERSSFWHCSLPFTSRTFQLANHM